MFISQLAHLLYFTSIDLSTSSFVMFQTSRFSTISHLDQSFIITYKILALSPIQFVPSFSEKQHYFHLSGCSLIISLWNHINLNFNIVSYFSKQSNLSHLEASPIVISLSNTLFSSLTQFFLFFFIKAKTQVSSPTYFICYFSVTFIRYFPKKQISVFFSIQFIRYFANQSHQAIRKYCLLVFLWSSSAIRISKLSYSIISFSCQFVLLICHVNPFFIISHPSWLVFFQSVSQTVS